jgi:hypothetical protein
MTMDGILVKPPIPARLRDASEGNRSTADLVRILTAATASQRSHVELAAMPMHRLGGGSPMSVRRVNLTKMTEIE